ncbi:MAG: FG-GAP repeat domain-containing protein [Myxococcota bacterium]
MLLLLACAPDAPAPEPATCPAAPALPTGCGDLDCDGVADLVFAQTEDAAGAYATTSSVLLGPDFTTAIPLATLGAVDVAVADLDGDDRPDLVFANASDGEARAVDSYVYWNGPEGFDRRTDLPTVGASDVEIADVDGDGHLDLAFANRYDGGSAADADSYRVDVWIYLGGDDGYAPDRRLAVPGFGASQVAVAGGDLAVAAGTFWTDTSWVYTGGPDGWSAPPIELPTLAPEGVLARDLDHDGRTDLVFANFYDDLVLDVGSVVYWGGDDGYAEATEFPTHGADDLVTADLDGDGCEELIVANAMEGGFGELDFEVASAAWTFPDRVATPGRTFLTVSAAAVAAGDLDGDGQVDLVFANRYDAAGESATATSYVYRGPDFDVAEALAVRAAAGVAIAAP